MQWDNLIVDEDVWEPRQPQDLVRGVIDKQSVPLPRPLPEPEFVGPVYVATTANGPVQTTTLALQSTKGFRNGSNISVMMDDGVEFRTTVAGLSGLTITLAAPLPYSAASGNLVTLYRANPGVDG